MATMNTYLNFNGTTEEAFNFYKNCFKTEFITIMRFGDTPGCEDLDEIEKGKIMHISLPIGGNILMGTDIPPNRPKAVNGTSVSISINTDTEEEARDIFAKLSKNGTVEIPLQDMFWGDLYGMFTDKFGIQWMINYEYQKN